MNSGTLVAANHHLDRRPGIRRAAVLVALAIVLSLFVLVQRPADAAPSGGASAVGAAQIDFRQFTCPILLELRAEYASSPFFAAVVPIIDDLLIEFGCVAGTTTTTVAPTTTTTAVVTTTTTTVGPTPTIPPGLRNLSCATLLAIRPTIANSPFFASLLPVIDLAIATICAVSG